MYGKNFLKRSCRAGSQLAKKIYICLETRLSVLTLGELQKGISKLPAGVRKLELQAWVEHDLVERFSGRIIAVDLETAIIWGKVQGDAVQKGKVLPVMDSLIAASASAHGLTVVTRNVKDIEQCEVRFCNPWG